MSIGSMCRYNAMHAILGESSRLLFNGLLMTMPGASEQVRTPARGSVAQCGCPMRHVLFRCLQLWHADGEHLFHRTGHSMLPPHCINAFIPLVDAWRP